MGSEMIKASEVLTAVEDPVEQVQNPPEPEQARNLLEPLGQMEGGAGAEEKANGQQDVVMADDPGQQTGAERLETENVSVAMLAEPPTPAENVPPQATFRNPIWAPSTPPPPWVWEFVGTRGDSTPQEPPGAPGDVVIRGDPCPQEPVGHPRDVAIRGDLC